MGSMGSSTLRTVAMLEGRAWGIGGHLNRSELQRESRDAELPGGCEAKLSGAAGDAVGWGVLGYAGVW